MNSLIWCSILTEFFFQLNANAISGVKKVSGGEMHTLCVTEKEVSILGTQKMYKKNRSQTLRKTPSGHSDPTANALFPQEFSSMKPASVPRDLSPTDMSLYTPPPDPSTSQHVKQNLKSSQSKKDKRRSSRVRSLPPLEDSKSITHIADSGVKVHSTEMRKKSEIDGTNIQDMRSFQMNDEKEVTELEADEEKELRDTRVKHRQKKRSMKATVGDKGKEEEEQGAGRKQTAKDLAKSSLIPKEYDRECHGSGEIGMCCFPFVVSIAWFDLFLSLAAKTYHRPRAILV